MTNTRDNTCRSCLWWDWKAGDGDLALGLCRADSPKTHATLGPAQGNGWEVVAVTEWPQTGPDDWCAKHEPIPPHNAEAPA